MNWIKTSLPTFLLLLRVFVAAGTCLPSSYMGLHVEAHRLMGELYKVRRAVIYTKIFRKISSVIQKLIGEAYREQGDFINLPLFFTIKESRLKANRLEIWQASNYITSVDVLIAHFICQILDGNHHMGDKPPTNIFYLYKRRWVYSRSV
jgi:hypothetical protein